MGTTKAFYFIQNKKQKQEELEQQLNEFQSTMQQFFIEDLQIFYNETMLWFPVFSEELVWQAENLDESLLLAMEQNFRTPVIAMSVLDSDAAFLAVCREKTVQKFICTSESLAEEFGFDQFSTDFPDILCQCGFEKNTLLRIWDADLYFDYMDLLYELFAEMHTFPVFSSDDEIPAEITIIEK